MSGIGFGKIAFGVEHERVVGSSCIRFKFGEDRSKLIAGVNVLIENVGEWAADFRGS